MTIINQPAPRHLVAAALAADCPVSPVVRYALAYLTERQIARAIQRHKAALEAVERAKSKAIPGETW